MLKTITALNMYKSKCTACYHFFSAKKQQNKKKENEI